MEKIRLTKEFSFEMSHALEGYDGACSQIHGHSYRLLVTVCGMPCADAADPKYGMVMDFGHLKAIVKEHIVDKYDHAFMIRRTPRNAEFLAVLPRYFERVHIVDFQPTCENLLIRFAQSLKNALPPNVSLNSLKLHETATSYSQWFAEDNS